MSIYRAIINKMGSVKEAGCFKAPPILVGGCGRSGTTLLIAILGAHPSIFTIKRELGFLTFWAEKLGVSGGPVPYPTRLDRFHLYLLTHRVDPRATRWAEKSPANVRHLKNIFEYYPDARFIHLIRDPRDVLTSRHPSRPGEYWVTPQRWVEDVSAGLDMKDDPRVLSIRYEDIVSNYEDSARKMLEFVGEDYVDEMENWHEHTNVQKNRAWDSSVQQVHTKSLGKWQKPEYAERVEEIMSNAKLVEMMKVLGYK